MEQYAYASRLCHTNAAFKTAFSVLLLVLCLVLNQEAVSVFIIVSMLASAICLMGIKPLSYLRLLGIPLFFILFGGAALIFTTKDIYLAVSVTLRALGGVSAFYFLLLSTPVSEIILVLKKCHVPKLLIELMYLIYRFIFVLLDVWNSMNVAAQSRLGYVDYKTSLHTFGKIAGNLLVVSMKRADAYYDAMESRCYTGELRFLENTYRVRIREWAAAGAYFCVLLAVWRIWK